jgi:Family of unknown function (DUF6326)
MAGWNPGEGWKYFVWNRPACGIQDYCFVSTVRTLKFAADQTIRLEANMRDTKERLSLFWIFVLLNYLYADVVALFAIVGSQHSFQGLPAGALMASAVLMEIPIAMIVASRLLPFRPNRLANIIAGIVLTVVNGFLTFVAPLTGLGRPPAYPEYLFFATIETVCTVIIVWRAWTWSGEAAVPERAIGQPETGGACA